MAVRFAISGPEGNLSLKDHIVFRRCRLWKYLPGSSFGLFSFFQRAVGACVKMNEGRPLCAGFRCNPNRALRVEVRPGGILLSRLECTLGNKKVCIFRKFHRVRAISRVAHVDYGPAFQFEPVTQRGDRKSKREAFYGKREGTFIPGKLFEVRSKFCNPSSVR
jgi:hypothetical protein